MNNDRRKATSTLQRNDMADTNPLNTAEEIEHGNNYAEGTLAWHAWGDGNTHAEATDTGRESEQNEPLSGEWADAPSWRMAILGVWRHIFGATWTDADTDDFFARATDEDQQESEEEILAAWVAGYHDYYADKYGDDSNAESR